MVFPRDQPDGEEISLPPQRHSEEPENDENRFYEQVLHRQTPGHRLRVLSMLLSRNLNARLACHEVTRIHWVVLSCLWQTDGLPVSQISQMLSQVGGSTSEVLDRMEERKLVKRRRARSDRRVCRVYLSERGEELFKILPARALPMNERMFQNFSEEEKSFFSSSIDKITTNLKNIYCLDNSPGLLKPGSNRNIEIDQATLAILPPFSVGYRLKVCSQLITRRFNDLCQPWEINTPQWHILRCLWAEDGLPVSVVGDLVDQVGGNLTALLKRLEQRHLVQRRQDEQDKRCYRVWLTPTAAALYQPTMAIAYQVMQEAFNAINQDDINTFAQLIERCIANLSGEELAPLETWAQES